MKMGLLKLFSWRWLAVGLLQILCQGNCMDKLWLNISSPGEYDKVVQTCYYQANRSDDCFPSENSTTYNVQLALLNNSNVTEVWVEAREPYKDAAIFLYEFPWSENYKKRVNFTWEESNETDGGCMTFQPQSCSYHRRSCASKYPAACFTYKDRIRVATAPFCRAEQILVPSLDKACLSVTSSECSDPVLSDTSKCDKQDTNQHRLKWMTESSPPRNWCHYCRADNPNIGNSSLLLNYNRNTKKLNLLVDSPQRFIKVQCFVDDYNHTQIYQLPRVNKNNKILNIKENNVYWCIGWDIAAWRISTSKKVLVSSNTNIPVIDVKLLFRNSLEREQQAINFNKNYTSVQVKGILKTGLHLHIHDTDEHRKICNTYKECDTQTCQGTKVDITADQQTTAQTCEDAFTISQYNNSFPVHPLYNNNILTSTEIIPISQNFTSTNTNLLHNNASLITQITKESITLITQDASSTFNNESIMSGTTELETYTQSNEIFSIEAVTSTNDEIFCSETVTSTNNETISTETATSSSNPETFSTETSTSSSNPETFSTETVTSSHNHIAAPPISVDNAHEVLDTLSNMAKSPVNRTQLEGAVDQLNQVLQLNTTQKIKQNVVQVLDKLLTRLILEPNTSLIQIIKPQLALLVAQTRVTSDPILGFTFSQEDEDVDFSNSSIALLNSTSENINSSVSTLLSSSLELPSGVQVGFTVLAGDVLDFNHSQVNSLLVGVTLTVSNKSDLQLSGDQYIDIIFKPKKNTSMNQMKKCVFWNMTQEGQWSSDGCKLLKTSTTGLDTCRCTHLTHFAQIINDSDLMLSTVQFAVLLLGYSISIVGSLSIIFTAVYVSHWRQSMENKVLINLSVSLALNISLLVVTSLGIHGILCTAVGIVLHYFILVSFCLMLSLATVQYSLLTVSCKYHIIIACALSWIIPVIPVGALLFFDYDSYVVPKGKFCFPSDLPFYMSAVVPLLAVLFLYVITLILTIYHLNLCPCCHKYDLVLNRIETQPSPCRLLNLLILFVSFSMTLILNFVLDTTVNEYMLCLTSSVQGVILLFYCKGYREKRENYIDELEENVFIGRHISGMRESVQQATTEEIQTMKPNDTDNEQVNKNHIELQSLNEESNSDTGTLTESQSNAFKVPSEFDWVFQ